MPKIKGDWNVTIGSLNDKCVRLTENDLRAIERRQEKLVGRIQRLTGDTCFIVDYSVKEFSSLGRHRQTDTAEMPIREFRKHSS